MAATYEFLIEYITDLRGITRAKGELRKLEVYNKKFGANVGKVTRVLGKNITQSTKRVADGTATTTRNVQRTFKTASGQVYSYSRAVTTSGGKIIKTTEKLNKGFGALGKGAKTVGNQMGILAKRALMVIPVWLVLRAAVMTVIRTISESIKAFIDLDDQLARIKTVMHGTAEVIETEMIVIKSQIVKTGLTSRKSLKELAEGFYFLKTANLSAVEAMAAYVPTVNLAIGTTNAMGQSARAVAGIYNTMGQYLDKSLTIHEKFQHIADVLAYTYSTQDVQLSELIESYTKMAPYVTGLKDSFLELTTMLGFLNTRLLRGGRTGRLTGRAILQLTKNSKKLALQFGITFKGDEPIALLETIRKIRDAMGKTGKITALQGQIIQEVFATRGGVAIRLLIEHFDDLSEQIKDAIENSEGFAKKMKEIRMGTIAGQMARIKNVLAVLTDDFFSSAYGAKNLADTVRMLGDTMEGIRPNVKSFGRDVAALGLAFRINYYWIRAFNQAQEEMTTLQKIAMAGGVPQIGLWQTAIKLVVDYYAYDKIQGDKALKEREKIFENIEKRKKINEELFSLRGKYIDLLKKEEKEAAKAIEETIKLKEKDLLELAPASLRQQQLKSEEQRLQNELAKEGLKLVEEIELKEKHRIAIMKSLGATALDIAEYEMKIAKDKTADMEKGMERRLILLKAENKLIQAQVEYRTKITDVLGKAEINMLKMAGASELYILGIEQKRLENNLTLLQPYEQQNRLLDIQIQREAALQQQVLKRKDLYTTVMERILKTTQEERYLLEAVFTTLLPLEGDAFVNAFKRLSKEARALAVEVQTIFTPFQRRALVRARIEMESITGIGRAIKSAIERMPEIDTELLRATELRVDRLMLSPEAREALEIRYRLVPSEKPTTIGEIRPGGEIQWLKRAVFEPALAPEITPRELNINIEGVTVNLPATPKALMEEVAKAAGYATTEELLKDPKFKTAFEDFFWDAKEKGH